MKKIYSNPLMLTSLIMSDIMNSQNKIIYEDSDSVFCEKEELKLSEEELQKVRAMGKKERKAYMKKLKDEFYKGK